MAAIADQQLTVLADWKQDPVLIKAQRDFLSVMQDASERLLAEIQEAVKAERSSLLRLPLTASELAAFIKLAELVPAGWQAGSKLIEEKLIGVLAENPSLAVRVLSGRLQTFVTAEDIFVPPPKQFVTQYRRRELRLAGVYEADRLSWVQGVVARSQVRGISPVEMEATIGRRFPSWSNARLHNIGRTESALLYEHGRVGRMQTSEFVQGYKFVAVIDGRTTDICLSRDEQVYSKADAPVPPLHFQCRSNLEPIFAGEPFAPEGSTERQASSPPLRGFGGGPDIDIVQPIAAMPEAIPGAAIAPRKLLPTGEWIDDLSGDEYDAIEAWTVDEYVEIRVVSRKGVDGETAMKQHELVESALDRAEPFKGKVFRGLGDMGEDLYEKLAGGRERTVTLDSLQSASKKRSVGEDFTYHTQRPVVFEIESQTAVDIAPISSSPMEAEVILRAGTKYDVTFTEIYLSPDEEYEYLLVGLREIIGK